MGIIELHYKSVIAMIVTLEIKLKFHKGTEKCKKELLMLLRQKICIKRK